MHEWISEFLYSHVDFAPFIVFLALLIAAFNIPISEDLTVITAGIFVASVSPNQIVIMHIALIAGAIGGDMLSYTMGRMIGRPLLERCFFRRMLPKQHLERLGTHFSKHSTLTILLGRFIPFGVRNGLSLLAGITRMPLWKFFILDSIPAIVSVSIIYRLSARYGLYLLQDVRSIQIILLLVFIGVASYMFIRWKQHSNPSKPR